ncbi:DUF1800 domain-containing protein [Granulicella arctica]|uniref:Uncharacterized protein (DUF1800 family) n=1 Tax=Granulicella arctica TaxID=940613 RepID=A0A7Y9PK46_9BACT|nr:DUF1800 domain-containing protein [Granulicella arctica]NYF80553.1 uncharacterized protein (DUF1800 family) [Granulicella arctica]
MRAVPAVLIFAALALPLHAQDVPPVTKPKARSVSKPKLPVPTKTAPLTPLSERERAVQMLNRFTFGPRPGDIERVEAMGPEKWFEQQLNPQSIPDDALGRRLGDFPTLNMSAEQILTIFPDRGFIEQVAQGKRPYPSDPLLAAMYEVQIYKDNEQQVSKKLTASGTPPPEPTDAEKAKQKADGQAIAARISGELFALPKNQRMAALVKMPVSDRIAFTTYVAGDQRNLLLTEFTPHEREIFQGMASNVNSAPQAAQELSQAKMVRAILSERQLQEVMTDFWFNHFNIYIGKDSDQWYTTPYERDVIRRNALGKFRDLLLATATSPAMMVYLDNYLSIGPDSIANGVNPANPNSKKGNKGLNENYGREVMELHTVGVNGGYTQADVTHLSAILTGWGVDRANQGGPFLFDPRRHEPGAKQWFGETVPATAPQDGMKQGIAALTSLAARPQTAHFISLLLAQRFVADVPPPALVDQMAKSYLASEGDIKAVLRTMVQSSEFNSKKYFRNKVKTPMEFLASAFRTTATDPSNPAALVNTIKSMGMPLYYALPPTGYYITADQWMNTGALVDRLNFAYQLTNNKFYNQKFDSARVLALGLLSQPVQSEVVSQRARFTEASETKETPSVMPAGGADVALRVLEGSLIGGEVSTQTNELIHKQLTEQAVGANPNDTLNLLTALVMGSPEFQLR